MTLENMITTMQGLSGDLTREKWSQWNSNELQNSMKDITVEGLIALDSIHSRLNSHFDFIEGSEWLVANFFALPYGLKTVLLELITFPVKLATIESFFKLVLEFDASDDSINCSEQVYSEFSRSIVDAYGAQSVQFERNKYEFRHLFTTEHVMIKSIVMDNTALILAQLFGEDRFVEVTSEFVLQKCETDVGTFINLVKHWDEFSQYPLSWAIRLAKS